MAYKTTESYAPPEHASLLMRLGKTLLVCVAIPAGVWAIIRTRSRRQPIASDAVPTFSQRMQDYLEKLAPLRMPDGSDFYVRVLSFETEGFEKSQRVAVSFALSSEPPPSHAIMIDQNGYFELANRESVNEAVFVYSFSSETAEDDLRRFPEYIREAYHILNTHAFVASGHSAEESSSNGAPA
jgi:hypothetical protein